MAGKDSLIESQSTRLEVKIGATFTHVVELSDVPVPSGSSPVDDVTTLDDSHKRIAPSGVVDYGTIDIKGLALSGTNPARDAVKTAYYERTFLEFRVVTPDNTGYTFVALVTKYGKEIKSGAKIRLAFTLSIDGEVVEGTVSP